MFRYLERYVGKYRVLAPYDLKTNQFPKDEYGNIESSFDDLYIPCRKGIIKHTYTDNILAVWFYDKSTQAKNVYKELKDKYKDKIDIELSEYGIDSAIYFDAEDISKIATIVYPKTSGASIKPFSARNLPKPEYVIPYKELDMLYDITRDMERVEKMHFIKNCNQEFNTVINKIKGKKYDAEKERKQANLNAKEFIHSIGLWDEYIKFVNNKYKEK